jgi:hypothetical protein
MERVKFAGINWYGFDSSDFVAGGLQTNTMENIVQLIVNYGFNAIRIPGLSNFMRSSLLSSFFFLLTSFLFLVFSQTHLSLSSQTNPVVNQSFLSANPSLYGLTALEILDKFVSLLNANNILIMLDNHVSDAIWCCDTEDDNGLVQPTLLHLSVDLRLERDGHSLFFFLFLRCSGPSKRNLTQLCLVPKRVFGFCLGWRQRHP